MKSSSSPLATADNAREEIRQRYLAACESSNGGAAPDVESYLAACPEPERSQLRSDLQSAHQSWLQSKNGAGGTIDLPAADSADGDHAPAPLSAVSPGTADGGSSPTAGGTMDFQPTDSEGTAEFELRNKAIRSAKGVDTIPGYDILGVLGRGAMGVVYKASQRGLKRTVALKMILSGGHASEQELARFRSEAEAVAQLQHPNIVQIYDVGEADGRPYFSLEFVDGTTLDKKVRDNPLPPREAAQMCRLLAQAMEYAHQRGIIHRDLKPANVLLTAAGVPKISDFGLAKRIEDEDAGVTRTGTILGTPSYMAPEQAEGKLAELGPRSDVYSLGAILYDLLAGRAPFRGTTLLETLEQVRTREPVALVQIQPTVPRDLDTICLKCLQKDKTRRYQSAAELADDLDRYLKGEPILARPVGASERAWRWCKRNPWVAGLSAAVALLVVLWAVSSSGLALGLKLEKDESDRLTKVAQKSELEAIKQTGIAEKNAGIAKEKAALATKNEGLAKKNELAAKTTADGTVQEMIRMVEKVYGRLQSKRLAASADPEIRKLREQVLENLRLSLREVAKKIDTAGASPFGQPGTLSAFGNLLAKLGQNEEALKYLTQAHELMKQSVERNPDSDVGRANLYVTLLPLGNVALRFKGDAKSARDQFLKALAGHEEILARPRDDYYKTPARQVELKRSISHDSFCLGEAYLALGDPGEARKCFQQAVTYRQLWSDFEEGRSNEALNYVMQAEMFAGIAASQCGEEKAAAAHFGVATSIGEKLAPKHPQYRADLADVQGAHGDAMMRLARIDEALKLYEEAMKNLDIVVKYNPDSLQRQPLLALTHERLGAAHARLKNKTEAEKDYKNALQLRKELFEIERGSFAKQAALVLAFARAGNYEDATRLAAAITERMKNSSELQLQLARCWAVCAAANPDKKADYIKPALDALQSATKENYKAAVVLETDPGLDALRDHARFQQILKEVKAR